MRFTSKETRSRTTLGENARNVHSSLPARGRDSGERLAIRRLSVTSATTGRPLLDFGPAVRGQQLPRSLVPRPGATNNDAVPFRDISMARWRERWSADRFEKSTVSNLGLGSRRAVRSSSHSDMVCLCPLVALASATSLLLPLVAPPPPRGFYRHDTSSDFSKTT